MKSSAYSTLQPSFKLRCKVNSTPLMLPVPLKYSLNRDQPSGYTVIRQKTPELSQIHWQLDKILQKQNLKQLSLMKGVRVWTLHTAAIKYSLNFLHPPDRAHAAVPLGVSA